LEQQEEILNSIILLSESNEVLYEVVKD